MFKLKLNIINKIFNVTYVVDSSYTSWHGKLGHVNYRILHFTSKYGIINYANNEEKKCEICT